MSLDRAARMRNRDYTPGCSAGETSLSGLAAMLGLYLMGLGLGLTSLLSDITCHPGISAKVYGQFLAVEETCCWIK